MIVQSLPKRYDSVAILLHWLIGVSILAVGLVELFRRDIFAKGDPIRDALGAIHQPAGTVIFALILLRIVWRLTHPAPALPGTMRGWEMTVAKLTHLCLYAAMIAVPILGIATTFARGKPIDFGLFQIAGPAFAVLSKEGARTAKDIHEWLGQAILALAFFHAAAGLWHHSGRRDDVLTRMLPQRS